MVLVLDDKISMFKDDEKGRELIDLASIYCHHLNINVIFISQNLFHSQVQRQISLQCQYLMLFPSPRSGQQIRALGSQIYGRGGSHYLWDAFKKATSTPYSYLLVDVHQSTKEKEKLKSRILPDEQEVIVYLPVK